MSKIQEEKSIDVYSQKPRSPRSTFTPLGDRFQINAKLSIGPNGEQIAEPGNKVDLQAYIQASKASTDMATIVARAKAGDETVLNVTPNGFYGDTAIIPSSINEYEQINKLSDIASEKFNSLPDDIKSAFGSSENFLNAVLNNKVNEILASSKKQTSEASKEEVSNG